MKKLFLIFVSIIFFPYLSTSSKIEFCADCWGNNCAYCTSPSVQGPDPFNPMNGGSQYPKNCDGYKSYIWSFQYLPSSVQTRAYFKLTRNSKHGQSMGNVAHLPYGVNAIPGFAMELESYGYAIDDLTVMGHFVLTLNPTGKVFGMNLGFTLNTSRIDYYTFPTSCC